MRTQPGSHAFPRRDERSGGWSRPCRSFVRCGRPLASPYGEPAQMDPSSAPCRVAARWFGAPRLGCRLVAPERTASPDLETSPRGWRRGSSGSARNCAPFPAAVMSCTPRTRRTPRLVTSATAASLERPLTTETAPQTHRRCQCLVNDVTCAGSCRACRHARCTSPLPPWGRRRRPRAAARQRLAR